jgi:hypothetical protein
VGNNNILERCHFLEDHRLLKRMDDAQPGDFVRRQASNFFSVVDDLAGAWRHERANQLEQRR